MGNSRTKNSALTMLSSGVRQILTVLLTFVSRTVFIHTLGADYLGLNGLFSNILSILALSELGIGSAISFYLYKPIADKDVHRICVLMNFYKICYRIVGFLILGIGLCLVPFLPKLVNFEQQVPVNLYLVYVLYLLNTASSYLFFAYKQAIVTANQEQYKIEKINIVFTFANCATDIVVLFLFHNYIAYLVVKFLLVLVKNLIIALVIDREYPYLKGRETDKLTKEEIRTFLKDIWSVSLFRIGSTLFNSTDNIIISMLLGTVVVGYYSNYYMIISQIAVAIGILTRSFVAGIGNVIAKETKEKQYSIFEQLDFAVFFVTTFCTVCLFQLLNSFVKLWIGGVDSAYLLSQTVVLFLCLSFFLDSTTQILNSFREGSGNFKTGRTLQIIGGIVNIFFSIILGKAYGLEGIFAATIIGKFFVTVSPFVMGVSKDVFGFSRLKLLKRYYLNMLVMVFVLVMNWFLCRPFHMNGLLNFIFECLISCVVPIIILFIVYGRTDEMKSLIERVKSIKNKALKKG